MRDNFGCGFNKINGFVNIDKSEDCEPDLLMDIETLPWPIETSSADEVFFIHCFGHVGADPDFFIGIMNELYRIFKNGAKVRIYVPSAVGGISWRSNACSPDHADGAVAFQQGKLPEMAGDEFQQIAFGNLSRCRF